MAKAQTLGTMCVTRSALSIVLPLSAHFLSFPVRNGTELYEHLNVTPNV